MKERIHSSNYYDLCQALEYDLGYGAITEAQYQEELQALKNKYDVYDDDNDFSG